MEEPVFKNYKEKQRYYDEKYRNLGKSIHISKILGHEGKVLQLGATYYSEKGETRRIKRQARKDKKSK